MSDTGSLFDTAALTTAAHALLNEAAPAAPPASAVSAPPATSPTGELSPAPTSADPVPSAAPAPADPPSPLAIDDTTHYRVVTKIDGREVEEVITGATLRARQMNAKKFTQEMQAMREFERTLRAREQDLLQQAQKARDLEAIFADPTRLAQQIQARYPGMTLAEARQIAAQQQPPAPPAPLPSPDADSLSTIGDVNALLQARTVAIQQDIESRIAAAREAMNGTAQEVVQQVLTQLANAHTVSTYNSQIDATINDLLTAHPQLKAVPEINDVLRFRVERMNPRTPDEMFHSLRQVAQGIVDDLNGHYQSHLQAQAVQKARLVEKGLEPPATPTTGYQRQISHRGSDGKFDWNKLKADAKGFMAGQ